MVAALFDPDRSTIASHPDPLIRSALNDKHRASVRWLVTLVVSGFLFAYLPVWIGALWLSVTLLLETLSASMRARIADGDLSSSRWYVAAIFAVSVSWSVHAILLWGVGEDIPRIAALMDLFTVALYGAVGGHKDKRVLFALMGPPLLVLSCLLISFSWMTASPPVAVIASLATLGACATIAGNGLAMHRSDQLLVRANQEVITERDALETRVRERTRALREAQSAVEAASKAKSEFLRVMSHELRTPINGILGYAELLAEDIEAGEPNREDALRIAASGRRLLALVNDVLDLASLESGQASAVHDETDIKAVIEAAARSVSDLAAQNRNQLSIHIDGGPLYVATDAKRLLQVLRHLVDNACKFTTDGKVRLSARLDSGSSGQQLVIEILDTGRGMSALDQQRLFEPFEQISQGPARTQEGAGLGLAITKRLMTLLGGSIEVTSDLGKGTQVSLKLPATP
jgi:signal transduction histidine kinase